jgi:hypothetical protein
VCKTVYGLEEKIGTILNSNRQINRMRVKVITLFFAAVTCIYTTSAQKSITVASGGKSQYSIVIPPAANDLEKRGAELLQEYLIKVANCKLPITSKEGDSKSYQ